MNNLTKKEILLIHYMVMEKHDDASQAGVRFEEGFESMLAKSCHHESAFEKACLVYHSIARGNNFNSGNKSTALTVFLVLLQLNNLKLEIDGEFLEDFTVKIAREERYKEDNAVSTIVEELSLYLTDKEDESCHD